MNVKILIFGVIVLIGCLLGFLAETHLYDYNAERYEFYTVYNNDEMSEYHYQAAKNDYYLGLIFIGGIIVSFPIMLLGLFYPNKIINIPMRNCPNCGRPLDMRYNFCPYCSFNLLSKA